MESLIAKKFPNGIPNILANFLYNLYAEGIEENVGDTADEVFTYAGDAYANPLSTSVIPESMKNMEIYDKDRHLVHSPDQPLVGPVDPNMTLYDEYGREIRDPENTTALDRVSNFVPHTPEQFRDFANTWAGGAGVSASMGWMNELVSPLFHHALKMDSTNWASPTYSEHMKSLGQEMP